MNFLYFNQKEKSVPVLESVKAAIPQGVQFCEVPAGCAAKNTLFNNGINVALCHDTQILTWLIKGEIDPSRSQQEVQSVKIVIAFSSQGATVLPKTFIAKIEGKDHLIYGFGILRPISGDYPAGDEWKKLVAWATELSQRVQAEHIALSQIVDEMNPEIRKLLTRPFSPGLEKALEGFYKMLREHTDVKVIEKARDDYFNSEMTSQ